MRRADIFKDTFRRYPVLIRSAVAVGPVLTVLINPLSTWMVTKLLVEIINDDPAQTLDAIVQWSMDPAGPWSTYDDTTFKAMAAGTAVLEPYGCNGGPAMRIVGTASGAGLSARITVYALSGDTT